MKSKIHLCRLTTVIVPLLAVVIFALRQKLVWLSRFFPECYFYKSTGYLCPACGNTRCIKALFKGHVLEALGYNITVPMLIIIAGMFYVEAVFYSFGKKVRIFPRSFARKPAFVLCYEKYPAFSYDMLILFIFRLTNKISYAIIKPTVKCRLLFIPRLA